MRVRALDSLQDGAAFDFVVVGSGFGGSVAALRLAQKGYSVAVLEAGRGFSDADFPRTSWDLRRYLWAPALGCWGLQRLSALRHVLVLSGAGLGGGSLVYGNALVEPGEPFYRQCAELGEDLRERLRPHFQEARRMLGAAPAAELGPVDEALGRAAAAEGRPPFSRLDVGVYFGAQDREVPDPYFGGAGPARRGCRFCGACMTGCRHNAKNTLAKNYLPLAERAGARLFERAEVVGLEGLRGGGVAVVARGSGWSVSKKTLRARRLVLAAGTLGTLRLLLGPRARLGPRPPLLGRGVRTNGEALLGAVRRGTGEDWSRGLAIAGEVWADERTRVEAVRYGAGSGLMALLGWPRRGVPWRDRLRASWPGGWAGRALILLAMQAGDTRLRLRPGAFGRLRSELEPGQEPPPTRLPAAERLLQAVCDAEDAVPMTNAFDAWFGLPATAHLIGGAARSRSPETGCVGPDGRLFGRDDVWILDGSALPANPGANPSLTITALAEQAMALVPAKGAREAAR